MNQKTGRIKLAIFIFLVILLSLVAIKPILVKGFFPMHDDTQPARVFQMAKALSFGQFPVRWVPDLGYGFGYPLFNFYAPLPYYIGAVVNLIGVDVIISTKIMFIIGILLSGISMYLLMKELISDFGAITISTIYVYAPYHAVNIYVRAAVGEYYAFGFLPLIVLGIVKIIRSSQQTTNNKKNDLKWGILISSIGIAGVFLSHNILGMITGFFLCVLLIVYSAYLRLKGKKLSVVCCLLLAVFLGVGLSSSFSLPAFVEKKYTKVEQLTKGSNDFKRHFVYIDQLYNSAWGFAGSAPGRQDGMSFKIGKVHLLIGLISIILLFVLYKIKALNKFYFVFFASQAVVFAVSIFFMLNVSKFIWEAFPILSYIQYPWRFLNYTILSLSILAGVIFVPIGRFLQFLSCVVLIGITLWFNTKYFVPREHVLANPENYVGDINLRFKISKISHEYLSKDFVIPETKEQTAEKQKLVVASGVEVSELFDTPTEKKYKVIASEPAIAFSTISFFPGWQAYISGKKIEVFAKDGRIELKLPKGEYLLTLRFENTFIRNIGNAISIFSLFLLVYLSLFWRGSILWPRKKPSR